MSDISLLLSASIGLFAIAVGFKWLYKMFLSPGRFD